jgi:hypothetical protein
MKRVAFGPPLSDKSEHCRNAGFVSRARHSIQVSLWVYRATQLADAAEDTQLKHPATTKCTPHSNRRQIDKPHACSGPGFAENKSDGTEHNDGNL